MLDGFIKTAVVTPRIKVADCKYNAGEISGRMEEAQALGAKIIVFPELCITGYTCEDLFWQDLLLDQAKHALHQVIFEAGARMPWCLWDFLGERRQALQCGGSAV